MIDNIDLEKLTREFLFWIDSVEEDDPLPFEIKNIFLIYETKNNDLVISYSADEQLPNKLDYGQYFPLEAQYFNSAILKKLNVNNYSQQNIIDLLKILAISLHQNISKMSALNIYVGKRFNKPLLVA